MKSRRQFVKDTLLTASGSLLLPGFLSKLQAQTLGLNHLLEDDRKLVILQLSGGNDGLNAIVPYEEDRYYNARPKLAVPKNQIVKLSDLQGLNPALKPLESIFKDGHMTILNSVGYPNPDRSHFRSMDIWHTASDSSEYLSTGWLGRYLDSNCQHADGTLEIGSELSLALKGERLKGLALNNPHQFYYQLRDDFMGDLPAQPSASGNDNLDFLYKTLDQTANSAEYLHKQTRGAKTDTSRYPSKTPLSRHLATIASLIRAGVRTRVFYTSLSGFDTHARQRNQQDRLLSTYAECMAAFVADLKKSDDFDRTLIVTFSEFGRRVAQNASGGTDHGTANNLYLMGGALKRPGVFNAPPRLDNLQNGDLVHEIDFRSVYATLLRDWLGADDRQILGRDFARLSLV